MNKSKQLPAARQVLLTFGLICVFLTASGGLLFFSLRTVERRNDELQSKILHEWKISRDVVRNMGLLQAEVLRRVLITDPDGMRFRDQVIRQIRETNAGKLAEYERLIDNEPERRLFARALQIGEVYLERTDSLLVLSRANEDVEKVRFAVSRQAPAYDEYQKAIGEMADLAEQETRVLATASTRFISKTIITATLLLGLAIAIIVGTGFAVIGVTRRIRKDNRALQAEAAERRKAGEALRENEERMHAVLESALDCVVTMDHQGRVVEFNPAAEKTFGYKRDAAIGQLMADLIIPPTLRERHRRGLELYLSTREASVLGQRIELTGMRSDHSEFPVELAITRIGSHEPPMFTGFMRDITERKQAEEALAEQAIRYKTLMETSADSIYILDTNGDLQEANAEFLRRRGYSAEVKGLNMADWDARWTREELQERMRKLVGGNAVFETRHRCKDGSVFDAEVGATSVRIAGQELFFCVTRDITERKQAERARHESDERFRQLAENISAIFWVWTAVPGNARCLYVSPAYETIWGRSCESLYSSPQSWKDALHPNDKQMVLAEIASLDIEKMNELTYQIVRPDQSTRWIRDRIFPVRDLHGGVVRFAGIAEDITESKEAEEAVRKANRQLKILSRRRIQEQEEERRRLSRELHDQIGQSLTAAKINVEVLRSATSPTLAGRVDETAAILDRLLGQVRQISLDLRPPMLDDLGLVPALRSLLDEQGRRASIATRFSAENIPENLDPEIQTTCFRIAQEAITNAVRHAKATQVDIALRYKNGKTLQLLVRDNGIGFNTRSAQAQADDLGLIGMKERASLVGGRARIMSLLGKGTTISVSLPLTFQPERQGHHMGK